MSVKDESRYRYAATMRIVNASGLLVEREHLDIRPKLVNTLHADNQEFVALGNDTWSRIGWRKLGDGRRWWIIADYSGIVDPWTELAPLSLTRAVTQLASNVSAGDINSFQVTSARKISKGQRVQVENLNPSALVSFVCSVYAVDGNTVYITPTTVPAVPASLSRVSLVYQQSVKLVCPSVQRAFFEALNFDDPLNTLVE